MSPLEEGGAGEADDAAEPWANLHQGLEALRLVVLEGRELVDDHHVVVEGNPGLVDQPLQVLAVDDRDVRALHEGGLALLGSPDRDRVGETGKVAPFPDLGRPRVAGDAQRGDHEDAPHLEAVEQGGRMRRSG